VFSAGRNVPTPAASTIFIDLISTDFTVLYPTETSPQTLSEISGYFRYLGLGQIKFFLMKFR